MEYKYVGFLDPKIAKQFDLIKHQNKPILVYNDRIQHVIDSHLKDFNSINTIYI